MLLLLIICLLLFGILVLICLPNNLNKTYKYVSLICVNSVLFCAVFLWLQFNRNVSIFQHLCFISYYWKDLNIFFITGLDGVSILFVLLTAFIFPFCVIASWKIKQGRFLILNLLSIELFLLLTFASLDIILFCVFFESLLIPIFYLILIWGVRERRVKALSYFYIYTLFGSIFLLLALFCYFCELGTTNYFFISSLYLSIHKQYLIWGLLFIVFAIKVPIFPFHIWLPEAHVEAPTVGSVLLAALLLKLGGYGIVRFIVFFDIARIQSQFIIVTLAIISIFVASINALRQVDIKRIIAYSSIAHINFALLGFFSNTIYGIIGGLLLIISHGIVSAALFLLIGVLYDRYHTRIIFYYGGLVHIIPIYSCIFFLFTISNFSFPGTSNFIGEICVFLGLAIAANKLVFFLAAISTFYGLLYSILLFNKIIFGNLNITFIKSYYDLTRREFYIFLPLIVVNILIGLCPQLVINTCYATVRTWVLLY